MDKVLLVSSNYRVDKSTVHFPKLLTNGRQIITHPFTSKSFYPEQYIAPSRLVEVGDTNLRTHLEECNHNPDVKHMRDDFASTHVNRIENWIIPNIFTVKTRKFAVLVNFNADGLHLNPLKPAFYIFQESLEDLDSTTHTFMLYHTETLPRKPVYDGFNYVTTHIKYCLFVRATVITV